MGKFNPNSNTPQCKILTFEDFDKCNKEFEDEGGKEARQSMAEYINMEVEQLMLGDLDPTHLELKVLATDTENDRRHPANPPTIIIAIIYYKVEV